MKAEDKEKLLKIINKLMTADTIRKRAGTKGSLTQLINQLGLELGAKQARIEIWDFLTNNYPDWGIDVWLHQRLTPGSLYSENGRVFGWWADGWLQTQAEALPLEQNERGYFVSLFNDKNHSLWEQRGFYAAQPLPVTFYQEGMQVHFSFQQTLFWREYGYAMPCPLQWMRNQWEDQEQLRVTRSIFSAGFQQAWKWWEGCQWWYLEKHPDWFVDLDWWGEETVPQRWEPTDNPYAAVLGLGLGNTQDLE